MFYLEYDMNNKGKLNGQIYYFVKKVYLIFVK